MPSVNYNSQNNSLNMFHRSNHVWKMSEIGHFANCQDETVTNRLFVINNKPAASQSCSFGLIFAHCANDLFIEQYGGTWLLFCLLAPVFRFPIVIFGQVGVCGVPLWGLFNRAAMLWGCNRAMYQSIERTLPALLVCWKRMRNHSSSW